MMAVGLRNEPIAGHWPPEYGLQDGTKTGWQVVRIGYMT